MGEVAAHECADDGEGIFPPYCAAVATPHQSHSRQLPLEGKPWFTVRLQANLHPLPTHFHFLMKMKIYRIPLAEYIVCVANIAFAIGKYITFGVAEYICLSLRERWHA